MRKYLLHWATGLCLTLLSFQGAAAQDDLTEVPLVPLPEGMTWEEYRDMNRRLSVGLALSAIPVPGMMHFYAGEPRTGKRLLVTSLLGAASVVAGAALLGDGDFPESDFEVLVLNPGDQDRERRYEKIPVEIDGTTTQYRLREQEREPGLLPGALILVGGLTLAVDYLYDFVHGIQVMEEKRDRVRFKYGKALRMELGVLQGSPSADQLVSLSCSF